MKVGGVVGYYFCFSCNEFRYIDKERNRCPVCDKEDIFLNAIACTTKKEESCALCYYNESRGDMIDTPIHLSKPSYCGLIDGHIYQFQRTCPKFSEYGMEILMKEAEE